MKTLKFAFITFLVVAGIFSIKKLQGAGAIANQTTAAGAIKTATVGRPAIEGIAHISLHAANLAASRDFYHKVLGFQELAAPAASGGAASAMFRINADQYVIVRQNLASPTADRLDHLAFQTSNAAALEHYLALHGFKAEGAMDTDADGWKVFGIRDPEGHLIEFLQYTRAAGAAARPAGGRDARISTHMIHAGIMVQNQGVEDRLYHNTLGFWDMWHGGMTDTRTDWVDMRVPQGSDWLEYMLNARNPSVHTMGVMHHMALGVPSVAAAYQEVLKRGYKPPSPPQIGRDGKWQLNLYDPDGTRVEMMEPKPVRIPCCSPILEHPAGAM